MKTIKPAAFLFAVSTGLAVPAVAQAECNAGSCSDVTVDRLYIQSDGDVSIRTSGTEANLSCDAGTNNYITLKRSNTAIYEPVFAFLLTAHETRSPIFVRTNDDPNEACVMSYVVSDK